MLSTTRTAIVMMIMMFAMIILVRSLENGFELSALQVSVDRIVILIACALSNVCLLKTQLAPSLLYTIRACFLLFSFEIYQKSSKVYAKVFCVQLLKES